MRSGGGVPGVMYVRSLDRERRGIFEGGGAEDEDEGESAKGVREWVEVVRVSNYVFFSLYLGRSWFGGFEWWFSCEMGGGR